MIGMTRAQAEQELGQLKDDLVYFLDMVAQTEIAIKDLEDTLTRRSRGGRKQTTRRSVTTKRSKR